MQTRASSKPPSTRDIARVLGLSHSTVAEGLRNNPNIKLETRKRVQAAAKALGYRRNPLVGAVMSRMRRQRGSEFQGVVAIVDLDGVKGRPPGSACYHRELAEGASERAVELGFKAEIFHARGHRICGQPIDAALRKCDIHGLLLLPVRDRSIMAGHDWSRHAAVYADCETGQPAFHNICPDHYNAMRLAIRRLCALGYRRPGLILQQSEEARLHCRWEDAWWLSQAGPDKHLKVPPLVMPEMERSVFFKWFGEYDPDVVICHNPVAMDWMRAWGAKIPGTHGFCCLNITKNPDIACSGLDQQPYLVGARGIELVIGQIYRNEYGLPEHPSTTTIPALWVDGLTLRPMPADGASAPTATATISL
ncbi:LacI family transcriptional regulator [Termitidicoccus mucosus]|uniref:HTH lacI-type domain-containing protein n=1 Tax=Termitidicoccus mucosus TaxID=1184151 RepID=A0A178IF90_9BACT|nr:hypothetical protein AW736_19645 [Opitutaceae bacterium TSB47]